MRGGRRVVFISLDDGTGPVSNVVFFHDAQERVGGQVFQTNYMLVRGRTRRSGARGVSVTGENIWNLFDVARQVKERHAVERAAAEEAASAAAYAAELAAHGVHSSGGGTLHHLNAAQSA
jgi:error-prone DNA polymerase